MNQFKKKLHSNKGASIILSLALMLICVMVASVVVTAAASGVNRNKEELINQQAYLAVSSAANYIAGNLNPSSSYVFCGAKVVNQPPCSKYTHYHPTTIGGQEYRLIPTPHTLVPVDGVPLADVMQFYLGAESPGHPVTLVEEKRVLESGATNFPGAFGQIMKAAATEIYKGTCESYETEFNISIEDATCIRDNRIPVVVCKFKMDKEYQVKIIIECAVDPSIPVDERSGYAMTIELPADSPMDNPNGYLTTETCTHACFYEYINSAGNVATKPSFDFTFEHQVEHTTTTVRWGTPVISKGGN